MIQAGNNQDGNSLSNKQINQVLDVISDYAEKTHCSSEAMGIQWWLEEQSRNRYKYEKYNYNEIVSMFQTLRNDLSEKDSHDDQVLVTKALSNMSFFLPEELKEELQEYKDRPIKKLPSVRYSATRYIESANQEHQSINNLDFDIIDNVPLGSARVFQIGVSPIHNSNYSGNNQNAGTIVEKLLDFSFEANVGDTQNEEGWVITLDLEDVENLYSILMEQKGAWVPDAVSLKRKLRITALHEIIHVFLGEGQEYLNLPKLGQKEEKIIRDQLAPQLLRKKSKRFSDYVYAEEQFLKSEKN